MAQVQEVYASRAERNLWRLTDVKAIVLLAVCLVIMLIGSWQRWTQPIIDHGREMNLPARIASGERLYQDVQFLYGPLAPKVNSMLFRIFGVRMGVLHSAGFVSALLILLLVYGIARRVMNVPEAFVATLLVLVVCAIKSTANYVSPYAFAALYALLLSLGSLLFSIRYWTEGGGRAAFWAGTLAGLALASKWEMALATVASGLVALILSTMSTRRLLWKEWLSFLLPMVLLPGLVFIWVAGSIPLATLLNDNHLLFSNMPPQLVYFNRHVSGLLDWPASFWFTVSGVGVFVMWCGLMMSTGAITAQGAARDMKSQLLVKGILAVLIGAGIWAGLCSFFKLDWEASVITGMPLIIPAVVIVYGSSAIRSMIVGGVIPRETGVILMIAVFAQIAIIRFILNIRATGPYTPFALPSVIILSAWLQMRFMPALATQDHALRSSVTRAALVILALFAVGIGVNSIHRLRTRLTYPVSSERGRFITEPPYGQPMEQAIEFAKARTSKDDYVLSIPQATMINFMAERRYPFREEIMHPGFLSDEEAIRRIVDRPPRLILMVNLLTPEFNDRVFGVNYNGGLVEWIESNYHQVARFDSEWSKGSKFGGKYFFVTAYEK